MALTAQRFHAMLAMRGIVSAIGACAATAAKLSVIFHITVCANDDIVSFDSAAPL
jgi:hypothetical protein